MPVQERVRSEEKKWSDETGGRSYIEKLNFAGDREWEKCEVLVHGHKNKSTGCQLYVMVDGEPKNSDSWFVVEGTDQHRVVVDIHRKAAVDITGYITNHKLAKGGGADIEVKCYWQR